MSGAGPAIVGDLLKARGHRTQVVEIGGDALQLQGVLLGQWSRNWSGRRNRHAKKQEKRCAERRAALQKRFHGGILLERRPTTRASEGNSPVAACFNALFSGWHNLVIEWPRFPKAKWGTTGATASGFRSRRSAATRRGITSTSSNRSSGPRAG